MCLYYDEKLTKKGLKGKRVYPNGMVKVWKVLSKNSWHRKPLSSPYKSHDWKAGWNKSDRSTAQLTSNEKIYGNIHTGMHVFLDRDSARRTVKYVGSCVVPVYVYKKDLIACGKKSIYKQYTMSRSSMFEKQVKEAVFMKVFLKKEDYDKAIGK